MNFRRVHNWFERLICKLKALTQARQFADSQLWLTSQDRLHELIRGGAQLIVGDFSRFLKIANLSRLVSLVEWLEISSGKIERHSGVRPSAWETNLIRFSLKLIYILMRLVGRYERTREKGRCKGGHEKVCRPCTGTTNLVDHKLRLSVWGYKAS